MDSVFNDKNENPQDISPAPEFCEEHIEEIPEIDPSDPFGNFTEYTYYNSDYREIVPQIDIPGCIIPFEPSRQEKKRIRYFFNAAGAGIIIDFALSLVLFNVIIFILERLIMKSDGVTSSEITQSYISGMNNFINESSLNIGLCAVIFTLCHTLISITGSKITHIKISSYFMTTGLGIGALISYCVISMFLRNASSVIYLLFNFTFDELDTTVGTFDFQNPKAIIITILYGSILAPIAEELMFRGFILKNLSRVSQRFGIFMSALLFGLMHGNFNQFFMAFVMGIFWAHIDIKHNSLLPSICVHCFSNTFSSVLMYSGILNSVFAMSAASVGIMSLSIAGLVLLIDFYKKNRLPFTMPHQKLRNGTAVSSVLLIAALVIYIISSVINSFPSILDKLENAVSLDSFFK